MLIGVVNTLHSMLSFLVAVDHVARDIRNYITDVLAYNAGDNRMKPSAAALNAIVTSTWGAIHNCHTLKGKSFEEIKRILCGGPSGNVHTRSAGSKVQVAFWALYDNILSKVKDVTGSSVGACEVMGWTSDLDLIFGGRRPRNPPRHDSLDVDRIAHIERMWSLMLSLGTRGLAIRMAVAHPSQRNSRQRGVVESVDATPVDVMFCMALYGSIAL